MFLLEAANFCSSTAEIWSVVGKVFNIIKIIAIILVLLFGAIDMVKAVVASKPDEIKNAAKGLGMRAIAAVVIFFIPVLVDAVFNLVDSFADIEEDYNVCKECVVNHKGDVCKNALK